MLTMHGHEGEHLFGYVHASFVIYNNKGSGCKNKKKTNFNCRNKA